MHFKCAYSLIPWRSTQKHDSTHYLSGASYLGMTWYKNSKWSSPRHLESVKFEMKFIFSNRKILRYIWRHGKSSRAHLGSVQTLTFLYMHRCIFSTIECAQSFATWSMLQPTTQLWQCRLIMYLILYEKIVGN